MPEVVAEVVAKALAEVVAEVVAKVLAEVVAEVVAAVVAEAVANLQPRNVLGVEAERGAKLVFVARVGREAEAGREARAGLEVGVGVKAGPRRRATHGAKAESEGQSHKVAAVKRLKGVPATASPAAVTV